MVSICQRCGGLSVTKEEMWLLEDGLVYLLHYLYYLFIYLLHCSHSFRIQLFGKSLAFSNGECVNAATPQNSSGTVIVLDNGTSQVTVSNIFNNIRNLNKNWLLAMIIATCYDLFFGILLAHSSLVFHFLWPNYELPSGVLPGHYNVSVTNSLSPVPTTTDRVGKQLDIHVIERPSPPTSVFHLEIFLYWLFFFYYNRYLTSVKHITEVLLSLSLSDCLLYEYFRFSSSSQCS